MTATTSSESKDALSLYNAGRKSATEARNVTKKGYRKWEKPVGIGVAVLAAFWWFMRTALPSLETWYAEQERATVQVPARSAPPPSVAPQNNVGKTHTLVVTDMWSSSLFLPNNRCFRFWGENPEGKAFDVEVQGVNSEEWYSWGKFLELRSAKKLPFDNPGWARFRATGDRAHVFYTFYDLRSSKCT